MEAKRAACRALVVRAKGKHFSGGADLEWMRKSATLTFEENQAEARNLSGLFAALAGIPTPTVALVQGAVYGGAVGLVSCCDWAIAQDDAKFSLSEVRVGLLPATILPYLSRKMPAGQLRRYGLSARPFGAKDALDAGLVQRVVSAGEMDQAVREELSAVLVGEPRAQRTFKALHQQMQKGPSGFWEEQQKQMVKSIAEARVGEGGQKGLKAFFEKKPADWVVNLPGEWKLPAL